MADGPPGRAVTTELSPSDQMICGAIENAMGLHFGWDKSGSKQDPNPQGYYLLKEIASQAAADIDVGYHDRREFQSVIGPYYDFSLVESKTGETYYDLRWRQKWRGDPQQQSGQSNDYRAATFDKSEPASLHGYQRALTRREFVEGQWEYQVSCSPTAEEALASALEAPQAPLYLGTSDGWAQFDFRPEG